MTDNPILTWHVTDIGGHTPDPNDGMLKDDGASVARVTWDRQDHYAGLGSWTWTVTCTGYVRAPELRHVLKGRAHTKDEAKAAAERSYRDLITLHPDNRQAILAHHRGVAERMRLFESGEGKKLSEAEAREYLARQNAEFARRRAEG